MKISDAQPTQKTSLNIWAVTDNKPGHQNQVEGLIESLSNYREVQLSWMSNINVAKCLWILLTKKCGDCVGSSPDLIIGAGHHTHLSLLALRHSCGGRVVIMMSPSLPLRLFDMCFIPRHDKPKNNDNVVETLGALNRIKPSKLHLSDTGLILIGGPSRHFKWDSEKVIKQVKGLVERNHKVHWVLAGSRRTPPEFYEVIKLNLPDIKIILPEDVTMDWLPLRMQETEQIWVTGDSISMIYEALTSGAKTGVLRLAYEKQSRVTEEIDRLIAECRVQTDSSINDVAFGVKQHSVVNEADRCAKILLEKMDL